MAFVTLTKINFKRLILRNTRFLIFDVASPIFFYLIYTQIFTGSQQLKVNIFISMAVFATLLSSIITVSNNIMSDRQQHFFRFMAVTPLSQKLYYLSLSLVFIFLNVLQILAMEIVAEFGTKLNLSMDKYLQILVIATVGSFALILIGAAINFLGNSSFVNSIAYSIVFPLAIISGLWTPMNLMPSWLQQIGKLTPTYATVNLIHNFLQKQPWSWNLFGKLGIWLLLAMGLLIICSRKSVD